MRVGDSSEERMKLVFATNNKHKFKEIQEITGDRIDLVSLSDLGYIGEIPEDFHSLEENAAQKAEFIYKRYGLSCFADDTGLEIEALNGEPGVFSARYAGENATFEKNILKVLQKMEGVENRKARFRTIIALVGKGQDSLFEGEVSGVITYEKKGDSGFGYDPIFMPDGYDMTFAQMQLSEKNRISHRTLAINKLVHYLFETYGNP